MKLYLNIRFRSTTRKTKSNVAKFPLSTVYHKSKLPKCNILPINCHILVILVITVCCCQINRVNPPMGCNVTAEHSGCGVLSPNYMIYCHLDLLRTALRETERNLGLCCFRIRG